MKKLICVLAALSLTLVTFAQGFKMPQRFELTSIEENGDNVAEVFNSPENGVNHYFLSVGHLGAGDEVLQVLFDPVFELFIPLGDTVAESIETLEMLKLQCKDIPGTISEMPGCLAFGVPDSNMETVTVTTVKVFLCRRLRFSLEREGYIRATYLTKSNIGTLVSGLKLYSRIHPSEP